MVRQSSLTRSFKGSNPFSPGQLLKNMLKTPKSTKFKKSHKGKLKNIVSKNNTLKTYFDSGSVGLLALESGRITPNHINCCRQLLNKVLKKTSLTRFLVFPHTPITKKPLEIRMGKGKGAVDTWVFNSFSGQMLIEIEGSNKILMIKSLNAVKQKLPIRTQIIYEA